MGFVQNLRGNRQAIYIIAGVLIVIVVICLIVAISAIGRIGVGEGSAADASDDPASVPTGPTATPLATPDPDVLTAREAYVAAIEVIRDADPGAVLASAAGAWTPNIVAPNVIGGRTGWTFHFFLPSTSEMAWVLVDRGGGARIDDVQDWETTPSLIDDQGWQVDSGEAVLRAFDRCDITTVPAEMSLDARLSLAASAGSALWRISVDAPGASPCVVRIDATTGAVRQ